MAHKYLSTVALAAIGSMSFKEAPIDFTKKQSIDFKFVEATIDEMKEIGDDLPDGYVAGWASTEGLDHYRDVIKAGTFDESIRKRGLTGPQGIKFLIQHDSSRPAGVIKKLETRGNRLWIEAQMNLKIGYVNDYYEASKMVGGMSFSVGYRNVKGGASIKTAPDGQDYIEITKADLIEVSSVTFPGNDEAAMLFVKGIEDDQAFETVSEFEKALVASGLCTTRNEANRITRAVKRNTSLFQPEPPLLAKPLIDTKALERVRAAIVALKSLTPDNGA